MQLPETRFSRAIDRALHAMGEALSWIWLVLLLVIVGNVVLRYAFGEGRIEFEEVQWHLYAIGFMLGIAYCFTADEHVRVDVVHERLNPRLQAWIELYGTLLLLMPFTALMIIYGVPFVVASFQLAEVSQSPGGLPLRWLIKTLIPLAFAMLMLAALARVTRVWRFLFPDDRQNPSGN